MKDEKKTDAIQQLKRKGYSVTNTADNGLLIEKNGFWGKFGYDSGIGVETSHVHLIRTIFLSLMYGIGILGFVYYLVTKANMKTEVTAIVSGV
jgi:hypothetical protein